MNFRYADEVGGLCQNPKAIFCMEYDYKVYTFVAEWLPLQFQPQLRRMTRIKLEFREEWLVTIVLKRVPNLITLLGSYVTDIVQIGAEHSYTER